MEGFAQNPSYFKRKLDPVLQEKKRNRPEGNDFCVCENDVPNSYDEFLLQRLEEATERPELPTAKELKKPEEDEAKQEKKETKLKAYHLQAGFSCTEEEEYRVLDNLQCEDEDVLCSALPRNLVKRDARAVLFLLESIKAHHRVGGGYYLKGDFEENSLYSHTLREDDAYPEAEYDLGYTKPASYFAYNRYVIGNILSAAFTEKELKRLFTAQEELIKITAERVQINVLKEKIKKIEEKADELFEKKYGYQQSTVEDTLLLLATEALIAYHRMFRCPYLPTSIGNEEALFENTSQPAYEIGYGYMRRAIGLFYKRRAFFEEGTDPDRAKKIERALFEMSSVFSQLFYQLPKITPYSKPGAAFERLKSAILQEESVEKN